MNPTSATHVGLSAAGLSDPPTLTSLDGRGLNYNSEGILVSPPQCGDLTELSQADLKGLVGEGNEDEIFTPISDPVLELDNIFGDINNQVIIILLVRNSNSRTQNYFKK